MKNPIAELLSTQDAGLQLERVRSLLQAAQAPVIDLVIRLDARSGQLGLTVIGASQLQAGDVHRILDAAKEQLRQQELAALKQNFSAPKSEAETELPLEEA